MYGMRQKGCFCMKKLIALFCLAALISLSSCYQIHSDDDLRTVPVTNNLTI